MSDARPDSQHGWDCGVVTRRSSSVLVRMRKEKPHRCGQRMYPSFSCFLSSLLRAANSLSLAISIEPMDLL